MVRNIILLLTTVGLMSCTWVELTTEGRGVAVRNANQVGGCTRTGDTTVSVVDRVGIQRSEEKVREELETLARNSAASRGDTIVAATAVEEGERTYTIYRCINQI